MRDYDYDTCGDTLILPPGELERMAAELRAEAEEDFTRHTFDVGFSIGMQGRSLHDQIPGLREQLGRALTPEEHARLADGWLEGLKDRAAYQADLAAGADRVWVEGDDELPF